MEKSDLPREEEKLVDESTGSQSTSGGAGASFKKLKQQSKGGKKKKGGNNPEHPNYVAAMKGFNSSLVDMDQYIFENGAILSLVAEEVRLSYWLMMGYRMHV